MKLLSHVQLFATPWTVALQGPPSMGFSRQEYWSGLPFPSPGDLPDPGIEPRSPAFQADALTSEPPGTLSPMMFYMFCEFTWFAYERVCVLSRSVVSDSLWPRGLQPTRRLCPWDFPDKNTGVGCRFLLKRIFLTQGFKGSQKWRPSLRKSVQVANNSSQCEEK